MQHAPDPTPDPPGTPPRAHRRARRHGAAPATLARLQRLTSALLVGTLTGVLLVAGTGAAASSELGLNPDTYASATPHEHAGTVGIAGRSRAGGTGSGVTGIVRIREAVEASHSGALLEADTKLREAMYDPSVRETARRMLHRLHRDARLKLPVDEADLAATRAKLPGSMRRYESAGFVLMCDAGPEGARQTLALLERTRHEMFRFTDRIGIGTVPHPEKLLAISFADHDDFRAFAASEGLDAEWAGGYYSARSNHIALFSETSTDAYRDASREIDEHSARADEHRTNARMARQNGQHELASLLATRADSIDEQLDEARTRLRDFADEARVSKAVHEAAHLLAFNIGLQRPDRVWPFWLSEGIATAFETDHARQSFGPGIASEAREAELNDLIAAGDTMPYSRLVALLGAPSDDAEEAGRMYAQSYGLFVHLANSRPDALASYIRDLGELRLDPGETRATRRTLLDLFGEHFGPPNVIQRRVEHPRRASAGR